MSWLSARSLGWMLILLSVCCMFVYDALYLHALYAISVYRAIPTKGITMQVKADYQNLTNQTEIVVPPTWVPPTKRMPHNNHSWHGYTLPVITSETKGRLGNVMGEYATLLALKYIYNVSTFVSKQMRASLGMFPTLSLPGIPGRLRGEAKGQEWHKVGRDKHLYNFSQIEQASAGVLGPHLFLIVNSPFEMQLFCQFRESLRREFTFSDDIQNKAQKYLNGVIRQWQDEKGIHRFPTFVGLHIRRGDYGPHVKKLFRGKLPGDKYITGAMNYYRRKFPKNVVFIAASDTMKYIRSKFNHHQDVYFAPGKNAALDLAVLSSCNHSIITLGSYGFWSGFLTGGEVIYPDVQFRRVYRFSKKMYEEAGLTNFIPLPI